MNRGLRALEKQWLGKENYHKSSVGWGTTCFTAWSRRNGGVHNVEVAGEMAQQLRALTTLPEVLSSTPSNHMVSHNHL